MNLARRSVRTRRMMLERKMVMMVKLQPCMYPLLPLRRLRCKMVHPLRPLVLDGDEAGHQVFSVSVRSFSGIVEDFTSAGRQADLHVYSIHS
jgi:hypothetical protein